MKISKSFRRVAQPSVVLLTSALALSCSSSNSDKPAPSPGKGGGSNSGTDGGGGGEADGGGTPASAADWTMMGYDPGNSYWNRAETKITVDSVANLDKAWDFDTAAGVTSTPVIADGKAFLLSAAGLFVIDLATGNQLWTNPNYGSFASLALDNHVLYIHDALGIVHAASDTDGTELWTYTTDTQADLVGFSSPIITKDYVLIGGSTLEEIGANSGTPHFRGFVEAIKKDGTLGWQKYTVDDPAHGATLWSSVSADEASGIVYAATGNNHGPPATDTSDAFLAIPLKDGGDYLWKQQINTGDVWTLNAIGITSPDADFGANPIVFDLDGKKLVAGGNKGGDFWVLDRTTGTVIQKRNLGPGNGSRGGVFINGAWDGKRLLAVCNGQTSTGAGSETGGSGPSTLFALDPNTLDILWERQLAGFVFSTISVANGVGFVGKDTTLQAFNTETGAVIKEFPTEGTIATSPAISNGYVVFGSGMSWSNATAGTKFYALKVP